MLLVDVRLLGYEFYLNFDYSFFSSTAGDCIDRYLLRFNEIMESCRTIYGIIYNLYNNRLFSSNTMSKCSYSYSIME